MGSWGHDRIWEREVVDRIRRGGAAPESYPLYEGAISQETGERIGLTTGVVYYDVREAEDRTLKDKEFRDSLRAAQKAAKALAAKEAAERKARAEERRAAQTERAKQYAKQQTERARQREQWAKETEEQLARYARNRSRAEAERRDYVNQENRILLSRWLCTVCGGKSVIERKDPGYQLTCLDCGKTAWGSHQSLWEVLSK